MFFLLHVFLLYFCPFQAIIFHFYRILGSVQWVSMSVCNCCDFSDVTLADEDTNSILADDAFILYLWGIAVFYLHSFWNFAYICFRWFLHFGYFFYALVCLRWDVYKSMNRFTFYFVTGWSYCFWEIQDFLSTQSVNSTQSNRAE